MQKKYTTKNYLFVTAAAILLFTIASCKKDSTKVTPVTPVVDATPVQLGLYEPQDGFNREVYIPVTQIGTTTSEEDFVFDTGSGGMVVDGKEILPKSMISTSGITFTGDSTVVNGITITNQTQEVDYGGDDASETKVYGNLAYANVNIGVAGAKVTIKRVPFFVYYKSYKAGDAQPDTTTGDFDVMGVSGITDIAFNNGVKLTSPFTYYTPGTGLTSGFKIAALGTSNFSTAASVPLVPGVVTVGLTADDLASSSGFITSIVPYDTDLGYYPIVPCTITYGSKSSSTTVLFDTGTNPLNIIADSKATVSSVQLASNTAVSLATTAGFNYSYSASDSIPTYVENESSGANVSIFGISFFINNEYILDLTNHKVGVKNN